MQFTEEELRENQGMARRCMQVLIQAIVNNPDVDFDHLLHMLEHLKSATGLMEESVRRLQKMGLGPEEGTVGN